MKISLKRRRGLEFHIKSNDYFGTLATVLDLQRQIVGKSTKEQRIAAVIENLVADLLYLQDNCEIKHREK